MHKNKTMLKDEFLSFLKSTSEATYASIHEYFNRDQATSEAHLAATAKSYFTKPGKALRPALLTLSALLCGGTAENVLPAAAAVEIFHTWTLIHDDIIDHDEMRRGHDTAHVFASKLGQAELGLAKCDAESYGEALAILGGDLLHGFAVDMLLQTKADAELLSSIAAEMNHSLNPELLSGEQLDIRLSYMPWNQVTPDGILEMMRLKTGALLAFCAKTGASLGNKKTIQHNKEAQLLGSFAVCCGLAFQLQDDVLGIFGDEKVFGKPIGSDIREGKRTLLMLDTLRSLDADEKSIMLGLLGNKSISDREIEQAAEYVRKCGALARCQAMAEAFVKDALEILHQFPASKYRDLLQEWAEMMTGRSK